MRSLVTNVASRILRITRPTENLPQTTDTTLFTITGGKILVLAIVGEVTTVIQTQANNTKLKFNPSGTGSDTDLCTALNISADAVGTLYATTGDFSDALQESGGVWALEAPMLANEQGFVLGPGDIELDCAASNTGQVKWALMYIPLDEEAYVTAPA